MKILLVGVGGYGKLYLQLMLENKNPELKLEGIVEINCDACPIREDIEKAEIPVYKTMDEFYESHSADLAVISTPPFLHKEQCIKALENGSYVLCEKPVAPTAEEAEEMLLAEKKYGKFIAVGYQWSYSDAIQALKKDILGGKLGKAISFKTMISWPRDKAYYARGGGWGGRISKDGALILDSIASNACAHYIHNMIFLLGKEMNLAQAPEKIDAEVYRANDIENFDTCTMKMLMPGGEKLFFAATHAAEDTINPKFVYTFENAVVEFPQGNESKIVAHFADGTEKNYGNPFRDEMKKFYDTVLAVKTGKKPVCTVETAMVHTKIINYIYENTEIINFPDSIKREENGRVYIEGLLDRICRAYEKEIMLSEV